MSTIADAHKLIAKNKIPEATEILRALLDSTDSDVKLNAILGLHSTLNDLEDIEELRRITDDGIKVAETLRKWDVLAFLYGKKARLLLVEDGNLSYRQGNLMLASGVFQWINFGTMAEKIEYDAIKERRKAIRQEVEILEANALKIAEATGDHYLRGHIFLQQSDLADSRYLHARIDLMQKGRWLNKFARLLFPRNTEMQLLLLYKKPDRRILKGFIGQCIEYGQKAIEEFRLKGSKADEAYSHYNLAVKYFTLFRFKKSLVSLRDSEILAKDCEDERLVQQITELRKSVLCKGEDRPDYVTELGLDLPNNLGEQLLEELKERQSNKA